MDSSVMRLFFLYEKTKNMGKFIAIGISSEMLF